MANALYAPTKTLFLTGSINLTSDTIKAVLVDTGAYTVDLTNHDFLNDLTGTVGTAVTLSGKSVTAGVFDATDVTFTSVPGVTSIEAIVIYKDTGSAATSPLIAYVDTAASGLPVTSNGGNIDVAWSNGASKILAI